ncbi:MAG: hypothetical protein ABI851_02560 [Saprospiraceae bacterium]
MKNRKISRPVLSLIVVTLVTLTSCNRGYGCPYDFSVLETFSNLANSALRLLALIY